MVGRTLAQVNAAARVPIPDSAPTVLRVEGLGQEGVFENVSFDVRAGEILGVAGLVGAGRTEIAQAIFGASPPTAGKIYMGGSEIWPENPRTVLAAGLACLPEDRDGEGLVTALAVQTNLNLAVTTGW